MVPYFHRHSEGKRLNSMVREYMRQKFVLRDDYIGDLRCFEYEADLHGRTVLRILVFNPHMARSKHAMIRTYTDLELHPDVLLYEGYVDDVRGSVYIKDCQTMAYPTTTSS